MVSHLVSDLPGLGFLLKAGDPCEALFSPRRELNMSSLCLHTWQPLNVSQCPAYWELSSRWKGSSIPPPACKTHPFLPSQLGHHPLKLSQTQKAMHPLAFPSYNYLNVCLLPLLGHKQAEILDPLGNLSKSSRKYTNHAKYPRLQKTAAQKNKKKQHSCTACSQITEAASRTGGGSVRL